jgi:hypothetical protein
MTPGKAEAVALKIDGSVGEFAGRVTNRGIAEFSGSRAPTTTANTEATTTATPSFTRQRAAFIRLGIGAGRNHLGRDAVPGDGLRDNDLCGNWILRGQATARARPGIRFTEQEEPGNRSETLGISHAVGGIQFTVVYANPEFDGSEAWLAVNSDLFAAERSAPAVLTIIQVEFRRKRVAFRLRKDMNRAI